MAFRCFGDRLTLAGLRLRAPQYHRETPQRSGQKGKVPAELDAVEQAYRPHNQFHDLARRTCLRSADVTIFGNYGSRNSRDKVKPKRSRSAQQLYQGREDALTDAAPSPTLRAMGWTEAEFAAQLERKVQRGTQWAY